MKPLDFRTLGSLEFAAARVYTFRCLSLARHAGEVGGTLPAVMNAANEVAVAAFLAEQIGYLDIAAASKRPWTPTKGQASKSWRASSS